MKRPDPSAPKNRRKFDPAFKKEAVTLWLSSGKSAETVAAELGVGPNRLYAWKKAFAPSSAKLSTGELETENAALRRDNEYLRQQRDILKKTLGILSEPPSSVTNGSWR